MLRKTKNLCLLLVGFLLAFQATAQEFVHPGGLHTLDDLNRMKAKVASGESPWIETWEALKTNWKSSATYGMTDGARPNANHRQNMNRDAQAAYLNALRWYISGDVAHAEKAISIYNTYADVVDQIPSGGNTDILGLGGIGFTAMALGAEIMRLYGGWAPEDFEKFKFMMKEYFYPVTHDFLTNHRGACPTHYWANWDLNNISAQIAIGILVDDQDIFNEGVEYFKNGVGNGSITNAVPFVQGNFGQWQESGRDQSHSMLGIGLMANICQLAWSQGVDLYAYDDNRFLKGAEYVARTGALSLEAPFFEELNTCSNRRHRWVAINALGRYFDQPVWEAVYNHYVVKQGLEAPHVEAMAQIMRFAGTTNDQLGYGTLTYTLDSDQSPVAFAAPPGQLDGLIANEGIGRVELRWNAPESMDAKGYVVKRSSTPGGPYEELSRGSGNTYPGYTDNNVENGTTYYYVVSAHNNTGDGPESVEVAATPKEAGQELAVGWTRTDIGELQVESEAVYAEVNTGHTFLTQGVGIVGGNADAFGFTYGLASGDVSVTARMEGGWGPKAGVMIRESLEPDAKMVLMKVGDTGGRLGGMEFRTSTGGGMAGIGGNRYTWRPAWFRITRSGNTFTAYESSNGGEWFEVGNVTIEMGSNSYVGLFSTTGNTTTWTNTRFEHVSILILTPPVPEGGVASSVSATQIDLSWEANLSAESYNIKRSETDGGPYTTIANSSTPTYSDTDLVASTTYYYVISAINEIGESENSEQVRAIPGMANYWKFDAAEGTNAADSWGSADATLISGATFTEGHIDNAVSLNGSNGYVSLPEGIVSKLTDFSITTWVKLDRVDNWARLFDFGSGTNKYMFLTPRNGANGRLRYAIRNGSVVQQIDTDSTLTSGRWYHLAVTQSGTTAILYLDGVEVGRNTNMTLTPSSLGNTTQNWIGRSQWPDPLLAGLVDDFKIYSKALNTSEIEQIIAGVPIPDGAYKIIARHSGKALEVANNATANGSNVRQWSSTNCACQEWTVTHQGNGEYIIVGVSSGKNLDVSGISTDDGANMHIWQSTGADNQKFTFTPTTDGHYRITPVHSGKAVDVSGISTADGANIQQWAYHGGSNQQWRLENVSTAKTALAEEKRVLKLEKVFSGELTVYPNPVSEKLTITLGSFVENASLFVHNSLGTLIMTERVNGNVHVLDLSAVPQGVYILTLTGAETNFTRKIVKK